MGKVLSIHSYRGGTGKSNLCANIAYEAAKQGLRVGVMDTDLQSPGVHVVFGFDVEQMRFAVSDFLFGKCDLEEAAYDLSRRIGLENGPGAVVLLPSRMTVDAITRIIADGYDVNRLTDELTSISESLKLDLLILDTHPGLNEETLLTIAITDGLVVVLRPDAQDYHGTAVVLEVARRMAVPNIALIANKVVRQLDREEIRAKIEEAFEIDVLGLLPFSEEMATHGSRGLFTAERPAHPLSREIAAVTAAILQRLKLGKKTDDGGR